MRMRSKNEAKILYFLTPCEKYGRAGGDVCRNYSCQTSVLSVGIFFTHRQSEVWSH